MCFLEMFEVVGTMWMPLTQCKVVYVCVTYLLLLPVNQYAITLPLSLDKTAQARGGTGQGSGPPNHDQGQMQ